MRCPVCNSELEVIEHIRNIPYFGKILIFTVRCKECGFKKSDFEVLEEKKNYRIELEVKNEKDLNVLVIRSSTAKIYIPELGLELRPGPAAEPFITTIEGVLFRFKEALKTLIKWQEKEKDFERLKKAEEILKKIDKAIEGKLKFKIIIEDPRGNSGFAKLD